MKRNSIIEKLYQGDRPLYESVTTSEETKRASEAFVEYDDEFRKKLEEFPELFKLYQKTNKVMEDMISLEENDYYMEGFRLGVLLGLDIADLKERSK